jgi:hypothetical protein
MISDAHKKIKGSFALDLMNRVDYIYVYMHTYIQCTYGLFSGLGIEFVYKCPQGGVSSCV